ncbi:MAG: hypothetical protein JXA53_07055 [Bacteroidales bacterium]|nr:hypothetical protein [Bacteroidales bacterium]
MAKRKDIKKDIDYVTFEVISDCFTFMAFFPEKGKEKAIEIINDTTAIRNDLMARVNHPDGKNNPKLVKAHYRNIYNDLLSKMDQQFEKLSALTK